RDREPPPYRAGHAALSVSASPRRHAAARAGPAPAPPTRSGRSALYIRPGPMEPHDLFGRVPGAVVDAMLDRLPCAHLRFAGAELTLLDAGPESERIVGFPAAALVASPRLWGQLVRAEDRERV